jgi:hypothetical protein
MTWLSRIGVAVLILALAIFVSALTLSLFPRTFTGLIVLIVVGIPATLLGELLGELAVSDNSRAWHLRAAAILGLLAFLGMLWWCFGTYAPFIHRHFLGHV